MTKIRTDAVDWIPDAGSTPDAARCLSNKPNVLPARARASKSCRAGERANYS
jgi:hypothetical protein